MNYMMNLQVCSSGVEEPATEHKQVAPVELPPSGTVARSTRATSSTNNEQLR